MKNATHQAVLDSLPPRQRRSKLEPYAPLIRALRARGRSYREIVTILHERCGLQVATHTVFHFVRARVPHAAGSGPRRRQPPGEEWRSTQNGLSPCSLSSEDSQEVWARIAAAKRRAPATAEPKAFAYDETEPLQLMPDQTPRKR